MGGEPRRDTETQGSLFRSFVSVFSGRATVLVVSVVFTPILVRVLTPVEFGIFATVMAVFAIVDAVGKGGLFSALTNQVAKFPRASDAEADASLAGLVLAGAYGVVTTVAVALAIVGGVVPPAYRSSLLVLASSIFVGNLFAALQGIYYGRRREGVAERAGVLWQFLYAGLGLGLAVGYGLTGVFVGYAVATYVAALALGWVFVRERGVSLAAAERALRSQGGEIARFGAVQTVGGLAGILLHRTDILLVNYFRSVTESGIYRAALVPAEVVWFVPFVIQLSLLQNASSHWSRGDVDRIDADTATSFKYAFLALTLFGVGLFGLADEFTVLYFGSAYLEATTSLRILLVGAFLFGLSRAFTPTLKATGHNLTTELVTFAGLGVNVALNLVLIPRYGMTGAAVGTTVSYGIMLLGSLVIWRRTPFGFPEVSLVFRLVAHLVAFAAIYLVVLELLPFGALSTLLVGAVGGGIVFLALAVALRLFSVRTIYAAFLNR